MANTVLGYEQITGLSSVKSLTVPQDTQFAFVQAETQNIRWRDDGTDPTATVGMILIVGNPEQFLAQDLHAIGFIEVTASAKLNVTYYGS